MPVLLRCSRNDAPARATGTHPTREPRDQSQRCDDCPPIESTAVLLSQVAENSALALSMPKNPKSLVSRQELRPLRISARAASLALLALSPSLSPLSLSPSVFNVSVLERTTLDA